MGCSGSKPVEKPVGAPATSKEEAKAAEVKPVETRFTVTLERKTDSEEAGVDVEYSDDKVLRVTLVKEDGLIVNWNAKQEAASEQCVRVGDNIVAVNDATDDAAKMLKAFKQVGTLELKLQRVVELPAVDEAKEAAQQQDPASEVSTQEPSKIEEKEVKAEGSGEAPATEVGTAEPAGETMAANVEQGEQQKEEEPAKRDVSASVGAEVNEPAEQGGAATAEEKEQVAQQDAECVTTNGERPPAITDAADSITVEPDAAEENAGTIKTCGCF